MSDSENDKKWSRRGVIAVGSIGLFAGAGAVTAASQTEGFDWVFSIFGAEQTDVPVEIENFSTSPPGRSVKSLTFDLVAQEDITVDVLVEIDGEDEPTGGWPLEEDIQIDESERETITINFDETYGGVDDGEILIAVEESS